MEYLIPNFLAALLMGLPFLMTNSTNRFFLLFFGGCDSFKLHLFLGIAGNYSILF